MSLPHLQVDVIADQRMFTSSAMEALRKEGELDRQEIAAIRALYRHFQCYKYESWPSGNPPPFGGELSKRECEDNRNTRYGFALVDEYMQKAQEATYPDTDRETFVTWIEVLLRSRYHNETVDTSKLLSFLEEYMKHLQDSST